MADMESRVHDLEKEQTGIKIGVTKISSDVEHIKSRIDNGISNTVTDIHKKITEEIIPSINDHSYWVGKWKAAIFWIAVIAVGGGFVTVLWNVVKHFIEKGQ